jgi:hypothetical protein
MEDLDLNINNYDYDDILNLFKLNIDFGENDLKQAKKRVLLMHPDKSELDKKYFLFFSSAYKILYSVYEFREKGSKELDPNRENIDYIAEKDEHNEEIIKNLRESKKLEGENFNKWFNNLFEKVKIANEYEENGYGDWLKNSQVDNNEVSNVSEMNKKIDEKKRILRSNTLTNYREINEYNEGSFCDLTNSCPESYSSGMFSSLAYEDLRKAHEESVVPVTEDDYKERYSSMEDIRLKRQEQKLIPLNERSARDYLETDRKRDNMISSHRAYKLARQQEKVERANEKWWSSLKQLKY